jgi:GrpB-like predicted nucleotidyltransferase (UPF0157 family)
MIAIRIMPRVKKGRGAPTRKMDHIDEPVHVEEYDPRWLAWYDADAAEITRALGPRLRRVEHFGSTAVPGLAAKPIVDILVAPVEWPLSTSDRASPEAVGYEYLGEAGVPGREYFRRRNPRGPHDTNLALVQFEGPLWKDNLLLRDYLRCHPAAALAYARRKKLASASGATRLLAYSAQKAPEVAALVDAARRWRPTDGISPTGAAR